MKVKRRASFDMIYSQLVKEAGLYGQAFFGHKATHAQKKKLEKLSKRANYLYREQAKKLQSILKPDTSEALDKNIEM